MVGETSWLQESFVRMARETDYLEKSSVPVISKKQFITHTAKRSVIGSCAMTITNSFTSTSYTTGHNMKS
jgi:hypothetical protein